MYGTLLPGGSAHALLAGLRDLGQASVAGRLYALVRYPALRPPRRAGERVYGRVYAGLDACTLAALDRYEDGAPRGRGEYRRVRCTARLAGGRTLSAWVYCYRRPLPARAHLPHGRWPAMAGPA